MRYSSQNQNVELDGTAIFLNTLAVLIHDENLVNGQRDANDVANHENATNDPQHLRIVEFRDIFRAKTIQE